MAMTFFSARLFLSYSRVDQPSADELTSELRKQGFRVFVDTSGIDPGDNFVSRLASEIRRSTAIVALISENYSLSRWGQAELYSAIASNRVIVPILISGSTLSALDEPLQRLLRDTQYVTIASERPVSSQAERLAQVLRTARRRNRRELCMRLAPTFLGTVLIVLTIWWALLHLNSFKQAQVRESVIDAAVNAKAVLQHPRVVGLTSEVAGDQEAIGRLMYLSQDPAASDMARFNSIELGSELRKGQKSGRWYVRGLNVNHAQFEDVAFVNTSFLDGAWNDVEFTDSTFAGVLLGKDQDFSVSSSVFRNANFFGGEIPAIKAIDVSFINTKFRGTEIDTTNFSKVRFTTEEPKVEGTPLITPDYTLIESSTVKSKRSPPEPGVLDLTMTGDDVVFDNVLFRHSRLEGWFRPEWFRNSTFEDCTLPSSLTRDALNKAGNNVVP
jgi:uncharacterized protein YjbI with pentapeptide repeats